MSDLFKSAFGYFSSNAPREEHGFVGQIVELDEQKLRVKRVIAEGERRPRIGLIYLNLIELHSQLLK